MNITPDVKAAIDDIAAAASVELGVPLGYLWQPNRSNPVVRARIITWMLALERFPNRFSKAALARYFKMDHTTLLHGLQRGAELLEGNGDFKGAMRNVREAPSVKRIMERPIAEERGNVAWDQTINRT